MTMINLVGLGPPSREEDAVRLSYIENPVVLQRLCWLLARLGLQSPRWYLPVGVDPDGMINITVLQDP